MTAAPLTVVKVGGSLASDRARLRNVLARLADGTEGPAVIVPGGGAFADAVRAMQGALGFSDALAHRLALDAMGRMAEVFSEMEPRLIVLRGLEAPSATGAHVWDPAALRDGHPEIAESWDVTSDSLALWLATRLRATRCILVKSASCPAGAELAELARSGLVDRAFPKSARDFTGDIVIRGPDEDDILVRAAKAPSSHPPPHPEVRGEAEPRRSPPAGTAIPGALLRGPLTRAPQDEDKSGTGVQPCRPGTGNVAA